MNRLSNTRVLMTADTLGGVWTYATVLARALASLGAEVSLVTLGPRPRADQRQMLSNSPVRIIESDLALEWQNPEASDLAHAHDFLTSLEARTRPDIVHLNSYREATFGWQAPVVVVAHSCVNSWGMACNDSRWLSESRWQRYSALVASGLDRADAWVAPTRAFGEVVAKLYQPHTRGVTIRNGLVPSVAIPVRKECLVLAAGRMWDAAKNLTVLTEAGKNLGWPVLIAGTTTGSAGRLTGGVEQVGELSRFELRLLMEQAAIFVSPARYEPFGLSVLEAAGAGCALVLSDIPTFRELWAGAAMFVAADDADQLRAALIELRADHAKRAQLQRAAHERAKRYSLVKMSEGYERLYLSLLSRQPRRKRSGMEAHP